MPKNIRAGKEPDELRMATQAKEQFLEVFNRECETTLRVMRAYPADKLDLRPHERSNTARELMWLFSMEQGLCATALTEGFDWSKPPAGMPQPPGTLDELVAAFEKGQKRVKELLSDATDEQLKSETAHFMVGPKTLGHVPKLDFLWFLLHDQIHHRGQLSVYLRMAGGRVPSIYGPTADEPWF